MKLKYNLLYLLVFAIVTGFSDGESIVTPSKRSAAGELLVKWRDGPESDAAATGNHVVGAAVIRNFKAIGWQHVSLPSGMALTDGMARYRALGTVLAVEPNYAVPIDPPPIPPVVTGVTSLTNPVPSPEFALRTESGLTSPGTQGVTPNDPKYNLQWNLKKIGMPAAWEVTTGSSNVVVAVVDTGVDYNHPDLAANMWHNSGETGLDANGHDKATNGKDDDADGYVDDVYGIDAFGNSSDPMDEGFTRDDVPEPSFHGSNVAGIIGAVGNNGKGVCGVNWSIQIMAARWLGGNEVTNTESTHLSGMLGCYDYIIAMKRRGVNLRAINNSYGFYFFSQAHLDAIETAGQLGILSVFSAGNASFSNDDYARYPSCYDSPYIVSVAATDENDALAGSNFGRSTVDLAAPGENITTTTKNNGYVSDFGGTSGAAPHVTGAAALLCAAKPSATWWEIKSALLQSVDQPATLRGQVVSNGRLNVSRALQVLTNTSLPPVVIGAFPATSRTRTNARIELHFNQPMDRASVETSLMLTPAVTGKFEWSDNDRVCRLTPTQPLTPVRHTARLLASARAASGATLDGNFNRVPEASPADDFIWTFGFPLPNDNFADAQTITNSIGTLTGTTRNASHEVDEPNHAGSPYSVASVWYRWVAETDGWVTFNISGNTFDTLLAAYGADWLFLNRLMQAGANDNDGSRTGSRMSFAASAGTAYFIAVAGKAGNTSRNVIDDSSMGNFKLNWNPTPQPGFTGSSFSQLSAPPGAIVTLTGTNFTGATLVLFNGASASFTNAASNYVDLRITATVPPDAASGPITIVTPHGSVTSTNSFIVLPPPLAVRLTVTSEVEIAWPSTSSAFVLEVSENLAPGSWSPVAQSPVVESGHSRVSLSAGPGQRFYRLRTQ